MASDDRELFLLCAQAESDAVRIVAARVEDDMRAGAAALTQRTRPPGRGSFPRKPPGYLSRTITVDYAEDLDGHQSAEIGYSDPAAAALANYRGGLGNTGAYGGTRRSDPFMTRALEDQADRSVP
jgi:hypothetical protein